jgi:hypothetical protein
MKYRKLRIAWSVGCGVLCALLIGLWIQSYMTVNAWSYHTKTGVFNVVPFNGYIAFFPPGNRVSVKSIERTGFGTNYFCIVPSWLPVLLTITLSAAPWAPWSNRFGLRTLLIAITILGLLLGTIIATSR